MERGTPTSTEREPLRRCGECGQPASQHARFCEQCGAALPSAGGLRAARAPHALAEKIAGARPAIEGERKQVTVMFADIVGSMELAASLDAERWREILDRFLTLAAGAVHSVEGTVHQFTGDGVMALYGAPLAHEDHARRACMAALELQRELRSLAARVAREDGIAFRVRCGLNSGEVIVGSIGEDLRMEYASIGNTNGLAKRMESLAPAGSIAISRATAGLVEGEFELRELGEHDVKGVAEPQPVFELLGRGPARTRLEAAEARGLSRFVGREQEQAGLEAALERALRGEGRIVAIVGEPGVGKSRLCHEFMRACRDRSLRINAGGAVAHGRAAPLLPVLAMFRDFFGIGERDRSQVARERIERVLLGLGPAFEPELPLIYDFLGVADPERPPERIDPEARRRRLLDFVSRLVEARSRVEPGVIVIEDLHWIDPASAAFLERLADAVQHTRTLLVVTFRPEYEAPWTKAATCERLTLSPLDHEAAGELVAELLGDDPSLDGLAELIRNRTGGNPFFIEEVVRALAETDHLEGERRAYRLAGTLEELVLPPTVQAVLGARIDRLPGPAKALVQRMSVIGREVPEPILSEVSGLRDSELSDSLGALEAAELITAGRSNGEREYSFKHPLTQEVAYASQLSEPRARAHAAVAKAIGRLYPEGLDERAGLLAHHSEAAGEMLDAARWHARAAGWISASSPADGMRHWRRVRELTDEVESSPEVERLAVLARIAILSLAWRLGMSHEEVAAIHAEGEQHLAVAGPAPADAPVEDSPTEGEAGASALSPEDRQRLLLDLGHAASMLVGGRVRDAFEVSAELVRRAQRSGDPGLIVTVNGGVAVGMWIAGSLPKGLELADRGLAAAGEDERAGAGMFFRSPVAYCHWARGVCAGWIGRLAEADRDYERAIELAREYGDPEQEAHALTSRSRLRSEVGEYERALRDSGRAIELAQRIGNIFAANAARSCESLALARAGDFDLAIGIAEATLPDLQSTGRHMEPLLLSAIATAKLGLGRSDEALAAAAQGARVADELSLGAIGIYPLIVLARALIATGGPGEAGHAEAVLERALERVRNTGAAVLLPQIHTERAALAHLQGDEAEAVREEAEAEGSLRAMGVMTGESSPARVLLDLSYAMNLLIGGREREAFEALRAASSDAAGIGDPGLVLNANAAASTAARILGSLRESVELTDEAISLAGDDLNAGAGIAVGNPYAHCLWSRAFSEGCLGRLDRAWRDFDRSLELAEEYRDPEAQVYALTLRATLRSDILELDRGLADAEQGAELAERIGNNNGRVATLQALAGLRSDCGEFGGARAAAERALAICRGHRAGLSWEPDALHKLAAARLGLGEAEDALAVAEQAVAIAESRSLERVVVPARLTLGRVLMTIQGASAPDAVAGVLREALSTATEIGYRAIEPRCHLELVYLTRLRGDDAEAKREAAEAERIMHAMGASDQSLRTLRERVPMSVGTGAAQRSNA